jgi:hypothetical protein
MATIQPVATCRQTVEALLAPYHRLAANGYDSARIRRTAYTPKRHVWYQPRHCIRYSKEGLDSEEPLFQTRKLPSFRGIGSIGFTELDNPGSYLAAKLFSCVVLSRANALVALTAHPFAITYGTRGIDKSGSVHRLSSNTSRLERFHWDGYNATVATVRASE